MLIARSAAGFWTLKLTLDVLLELTGSVMPAGGATVALLVRPVPRLLP